MCIESCHEIALRQELVRDRRGGDLAGAAVARNDPRNLDSLALYVLQFLGLVW